MFEEPEKKSPQEDSKYAPKNKTCLVRQYVPEMHDAEQLYFFKQFNQRIN